MSGVGLALVPSNDDCQAILSLLSESASAGVEFAFALHTSNSIAHMSLMQATFDSEQTAIDLLQQLDLPGAGRRALLTENYRAMAVHDISVWASKIVFLNFALIPELQQLHCQVADLWLPKALPLSADPQNFKNISAGQMQSFAKTGYPFSYEQYLPHITLGHLKSEINSAANIELLNNLLKRRLPKAFCFERLVAFAVEPFGVCRRIIREWPL